MEIILSDYAKYGRLLGTREVALPIRDTIENCISEHGFAEKITINFANTNPTQSFVDELIGVLVQEYGFDIVRIMVMKNCDEDIKSILHFVIGDRLKDFTSKNQLD